MGLKKRSKVSAEFNMSSLTDIIFLLLIFFMLTSTLVSPNALNIRWPSSSQENPTVSHDSPPKIDISSSGKIRINNKTVSKPEKANVTTILSSIKKNYTGGKFDVILSPSPSAPYDQVILVMDVTQKLGIEPIMAVEK